MNKKQACISVDEWIWDEAGRNLPMSRSEFIENQLRLYLNIEDEEQKIVEQITKEEQKLNALKQKLCDIRKNKEERLKSKSLFEDAEKEVQHFHEQQDCIGRNQIRQIAKRFDVPALEFENKITENNEYKVVNYMLVGAKGLREAR